MGLLVIILLLCVALHGLLLIVVCSCLVVTSVRWVIAFLHFIWKSAIGRCTHHEVIIVGSAA